jgi:hypothetical protein
VEDLTLYLVEPNSNNTELALAYQLFKDTQQDNLEYIYRGKFNTDITDNILSLAEESLRLSEQKLSIKKRVYFVMVEGLQNITRHQDITAKNIPVKPGLFVLQRKMNSYFITTGNLIEKRNISILKGQLEKVNSLTKDELNEYYKTHLNDGGYSGKGGAGLGLIEIARKSKGSLAFDFRKIKGKYYYFYLLTEIPFSETDEENNSQIGTVNNSLQNIKDLHDILNKEQITLNYSGIFNQENLVNLLGIIEKQMMGTLITKNKTFNVMVEMLQNLVKHADHFKINQVMGNHGIFFITENDEEFILTTGNYVKNEKSNDLANHLFHVNSLDTKGLNAFYNRNLLNTEKETKRIGAGLGIIDMRLKSQEKLDYKFEKVDDQYSFFTLRIHIKKSENKLEKYFFEGSDDRPMIELNPIGNKFVFKGRSIPENAFDFYKPVIDWIDLYSKNPNAISLFEFRFDHLNTHSTQQIMKILQRLDKFPGDSKVKIEWFYNKDDTDMLEIGNRLKEILGVDLKFVEEFNS